MKILLDECITKRLKKHLAAFDVYTIRELGLSGIKNGKLMTYCVEYGFDILLTIDKNMMYQQNLEKYALTIVVLNTVSSKLEAITNLLPSFTAQLNQFEKRRAYIINPSD